jgi:hypothetical protein
MAQPVDDVRNFSPFWHALLSGEHPMLRRGRKMFRLLSPTASDRCRLCFAGFDGFTKGGEMVTSEAVWKEVSDQITAEPRSLELKGYSEPVKAYVARMTPDQPVA